MSQGLSHVSYYRSFLEKHIKAMLTLTLTACIFQSCRARYLAVLEAFHGSVNQRPIRQAKGSRAEIAMSAQASSESPEYLRVAELWKYLKDLKATLDEVAVPKSSPIVDLQNDLAKALESFDTIRMTPISSSMGQTEKEIMICLFNNNSEKHGPWLGKVYYRAAEIQRHQGEILKHQEGIQKHQVEIQRHQEQLTKHQGLATRWTRELEALHGDGSTSGDFVQYLKMVCGRITGELGAAK